MKTMCYLSFTKQVGIWNPMVEVSLYNFTKEIWRLFTPRRFDLNRKTKLTDGFNLPFSSDLQTRPPRGGVLEGKRPACALGTHINGMPPLWPYAPAGWDTPCWSRCWCRCACCWTDLCCVVLRAASQGPSPCKFGSGPSIILRVTLCTRRWRYILEFKRYDFGVR
jgi:hypothetical protein